MKKSFHRIALISCALLSLVAGCKKTAKKTTSCTATLYGYYVPHATLWDTIGSNSFGIINPLTISGTSIGYISTSSYANQAAFNSSDNCYYAFRTRMGSGAGAGVLYKTDLSGTLTTFTSTTTGCYCLTYNRVNNKLYCIAPSGVLAEVSISGSTFSATTVVAPVHPFFSATFGANTTVDDNSGDIYYVTGGSSTYYIEKYITGASSSVVVATGSTGWEILGLRYNKNNNMLYAIEMLNPPVGTSSYAFVKIDPSAGTIATMSLLGFDVNPEFYSACIDPCTDKYFVSTLSSGSSAWDTCVVNQLNMSGSLLQHDTTAGLFQGMYINY